jgi:hypothetical protein
VTRRETLPSKETEPYNVTNMLYDPFTRSFDGVENTLTEPTDTLPETDDLKCTMKRELS